MMIFIDSFYIAMALSLIMLYFLWSYRTWMKMGVSPLPTNVTA